MKINRLILPVVLLLGAGFVSTISAADDAVPPQRPNREGLREELREQLKSIPPEEREARMKELREKFGPLLREELKDLSPEEREKKIQEFRQKNGGLNRPGVNTLAPEQREAKRKELRARFDKQLAELRQKQADGKITDEEKTRLQRLEELSKRFESAAKAGRGDKPEKPSGDN